MPKRKLPHSDKKKYSDDYFDHSDIFYHKYEHLSKNPYYDAHHDSYTEYNRYFSKKHKTNPILASIFELSEKIDEINKGDDGIKNQELISLMELRKNKISKIINSKILHSELITELINILELFKY
jgi:hypothetical protein